MNDRTLGYIILTLIAVFVITFGTYFVLVNYYPPDRRIILFKEIGNLKIEDPVTEYGITIGRVERIDWRPAGVYVSVIFFKPITIRDSYHIFIEDKGLMGERVISLFCGRPDSPALSSSDTLYGTMKIGVSEALNMMWLLEYHTQRIRKEISLLRHGNRSKPSFAISFRRFIRDIDSLSVQMELMLRSLHQYIGGTIDTVNYYIAEAHSFSERVRNELPHWERSIVSFTSKTNALCEQLSDLIDMLSENLSRFPDPRTVWWRNDLLRLSRRLETLHLNVMELKKRGLLLQVQPFFD